MKNIDFIIFIVPYFGIEHYFSFKSLFSKGWQLLTEIYLSVVDKAG